MNWSEFNDKPGRDYASLPEQAQRNTLDAARAWVLVFGEPVSVEETTETTYIVRLIWKPKDRVVVRREIVIDTGDV